MPPSWQPPVRLGLTQSPEQVPPARLTGVAQRVAVIIVTHNSAAFFERIIAALNAQTRKPDQLIVLDSGSDPDQSPLSVQWPSGALVQDAGANIGFAAANNRAVAQADCDLVCLLNPDAFPEPDWLQNLMRAADMHPTAASFGSIQISASMDGCYDGLGDCYHVAGLPWRGGFGAPLAKHSPAPEGAVFSACAAAALYRRDIWMALGGFDERFFCYCEDVDLGFRLRLAGHEVRQVRDAVVHHVGGASSGRRSYFAVFHGTRNRLWTYVKSMPGWALWAFLPAHLAMTAAFLAISPFRGTGRATWAGVMAALGGLKEVWRDRQAVQSTRKASTGRIVAQMAWSPSAVVTRAPIVR